jgi:predicted PhzF superfamily epimerase YddE/YHI9
MCLILTLAARLRRAAYSVTSVALGRVLSSWARLSEGTVLGRAGRIHVERAGLDIWVAGDTVTCIEGKINV